MFQPIIGVSIEVVLNKEGEPESFPIDDEKNVNIRRAKIELQHIEGYAKYFGNKYEPRHDNRKRKDMQL